MTPGWWAAALLVLVTPVPEAPSLAAWHGNWVGEGQAFGKPATATLDWRLFATLHYRRHKR